MKNFLGVALFVFLAGCASAPPLTRDQQLEVLDGVVTSIDIKSVQFHSRQSEFRDPVGPVSVGQSIRFRVKAKSNDLSTVTLVIQDKYIEGNQSSVTWSDLESIAMTRSPQDELWDVWEASYAPDYAGTAGRPCLLLYFS